MDKKISARKLRVQKTECHNNERERAKLDKPTSVAGRCNLFDESTRSEVFQWISVACGQYRIYPKD